MLRHDSAVHTLDDFVGSPHSWGYCPERLIVLQCVAGTEYYTTAVRTTGINSTPWPTGHFFFKEISTSHVPIHIYPTLRRAYSVTLSPNQSNSECCVVVSHTYTYQASGITCLFYFRMAEIPLASKASPADIRKMCVCPPALGKLQTCNVVSNDA